MQPPSKNIHATTKYNASVVIGGMDHSKYPEQNAVYAKVCHSLNQNGTGEVANFHFKQLTLRMVQRRQRKAKQITNTAY